MSLLRKYINPKYEISDFFCQINNLGIKYVVLRWFNDSKLDDIDILVADIDIAKINKFIILGENLNAAKLDVYSASGLHGTGYAKIPYYPRVISDIILNNRVLANNIFTPVPFVFFLSFIFHVVYHKSEKSGIPVSGAGKIRRNIKNKYIDEIKRCEKAVNLKIGEITLNRLRFFLDNYGWSPSVDWIRKIAYNNNSPWLMSLYPAQAISSSTLSVFILRDKARDNFLESEIINLFEKEGIYVLYHSVLNRKQRTNAKILLRSGKWDKGPYKIGGGNPYSIYVLLDQLPREPDNCIKSKYPYLQNYNFLLIKEKIRLLCKNVLKIQTDINCVHSCDDEIESFEYLSIVAPDEIIKLNEKRRQIDLEFESEFEVVKKISNNGRRAKIELINFNNQLAICKTFKRGKERYFQRELFAYTFLQKTYDFIPKLFTYSKNKLIIEYIEHDICNQRNLINKNLPKVAFVFHALWKVGCSHLDIHPDNIIIDNNGKLYLIDYEFFYINPIQSESAIKSYDVVGIENHEEWGIIGHNPSLFISNIWLKYTGFSLVEILKDHL